MTIFEKHPEFSKGRLTAMLGRVSKLYDAGYTAEEIASLLRKPVTLVNELIEIKKKAEENRKNWRS